MKDHSCKHCFWIFSFQLKSCQLQILVPVSCIHHWFRFVPYVNATRFFHYSIKAGNLNIPERRQRNSSSFGYCFYPSFTRKPSPKICCPKTTTNALVRITNERPRRRRQQMSTTWGKSPGCCLSDVGNCYHWVRPARYFWLNWLQSRGIPKSCNNSQPTLKEKLILSHFWLASFCEALTNIRQF